MKLSESQKQDIESSIPASAVVRKALDRYLEATGMTASEFADAVGCSYNKVKYFLRDEYSAIAESDQAARRDLWEWMQAHPVVPETKAAGKLYPTDDYRVLRRYFYRALNDHRAYVIQGDPGVGKSFCAEHLVAELNRREIADNGSGRRAYYVYVEPTIHTPVQLLKEIARSCGVSPTGDGPRVVRALRRSFSGRTVLIAIDEAHHLSVSALEAVRVLLDRPPYCGLLILGSHDLHRRFNVEDPVKLEQWRRRIKAFATLHGLTADEARLIVTEELPSANEAAIRSILKDCKVEHLARSRDEQKSQATYVSAGRLFDAIKDIKRSGEEDGE